MANIFNDSIEESENPIKKIITRKNILFILLFLIFLNLLYLDLLFFQNSGIQTVKKIIPVPSQSDLSDNCSSLCVDQKINNAISAFKTNNSLIPSVTPIPTKAVIQTNSVNVSREFYIPFGSGSGSSSDWQDVGGLQAYVDSSNYPSIKSVVFESSLHIPTGNQIASVRLYNATDGHPVWNSQIDFNGNTSSLLLTSQVVYLDSGNKLYKVQMKTQLQFQAVLDQSRLHITTK